MKRKIFRLLEEYMLANIGDAAHDGEHIRRVLYAALDIARYEESVDYDVLVAACLLHDIARPIQMKDPSRKHAPEGAGMAHEFLMANGFGAEFADRVADCIRVHSSADDSARSSIEAKILFDADKLDTAGALGVARILMCGAAYGEPLYTRNETGLLQDACPPRKRFTVRCWANSARWTNRAHASCQTASNDFLRNFSRKTMRMFNKKVLNLRHVSCYNIRVEFGRSAAT